MFLERSGEVLAVSQPTHAWVAGRLLRAWAAPLDDLLLLAAEQHDAAWLDWEVAPPFDAATGRPPIFFDVGAAAHAPLWEKAVERAAAAWGSRVALMISRHGCVIYTRFIDRHRGSDADAAAAARFIAQQAPVQDGWARALGLGKPQLDHESDLIAFADTISLALCGALATPLDLTGPGVTGGPSHYRLQAGGAGAFTLTPWPFRDETLVIDAEGRRVPGGRFADEAAMRAWLAAPPRAAFRVSLSAG